MIFILWPTAKLNARNKPSDNICARWPKEVPNGSPLLMPLKCQTQHGHNALFLKTCPRYHPCLLPDAHWDTKDTDLKDPHTRYRCQTHAGRLTIMSRKSSKKTKSTNATCSRNNELCCGQARDGSDASRKPRTAEPKKSLRCSLGSPLPHPCPISDGSFR